MKADYKFKRLSQIFDETSSLKRMIYVLKNAELTERQDQHSEEEAITLDEAEQETKARRNGALLKVDMSMVKEQDLVLEFATLSTTGMVTVKDGYIYVEPDYVNWLFEFMKEADEQGSFSEIFGRY